jgi:hypothetical protein
MRVERSFIYTALHMQWNTRKIPPSREKDRGLPGSDELPVGVHGHHEAHQVLPHAVDLQRGVEITTY